MKTGKNYQTHPYMQNRWARVGRKLAFSSQGSADAVQWRAAVSRTVKQLTGYDTMLPAGLEPRITEEAIFDGYTRQRVEIQTEPGVIMPLYVLIPQHSTPPYPAVIAPHGHSSGGKLAVAGCRELPEIAQTIDEHNYDYGVQFVRAGFITFCPDARGFGERQEDAARDSILNASCQWLNNMALPLGQTVTGMWTWDIHRLVDYVQSRGDCIADRIGCAGLSGGGLQTLWASALDERINCAVISGYLYGYKESLLDLHTNCSCNYVPHLYEYVDMGDIAALIAPRPLLVETGTQDALNGASGLDNVITQMEIVRSAYRVWDAEDMVKHDVFEGEHRWNGVEAIPWMQRHLGV
ncbi:MAG: alpha/beta hydrolase family protein [Anaerolineae bacterium]|nr:alpha/beta hydrolase family protein [Anaerolineae bacterium]